MSKRLSYWKHLMRSSLIKTYSMRIKREERLIKYFSRRSIGSVNPFEMGGEERGDVYVWNIYVLYAQHSSRCFTYAMQFNPDNSLVWYTYLFLFNKWKKKNGTLAGYLICLRSNGKEMEDALFGARCGSFKGHALFISEWVLIHHIAFECCCLGEWWCR